MLEGEQARVEPIVEQQVDIQVEPEQPENQIQNDQEDLPVEPQQPLELRRSGRTTRKPSRYLLLGESYQAITIDSEEDPINYKEALEDVDAQEWLKAMDREMESMHSNSVWSLVEAPKGVKCGTPFPARPVLADPNRVRDALLSLQHSKSNLCGSDFKIWASP